jgi:hypothetical protein
LESRCNQFAVHFLAPNDLATQVAKRTITTSAFSINELGQFASALKLSLEASLYRLVELGFYNGAAVGAWHKFIESQGNPEAAPAKVFAKNVPQWKYKLSRYGYKFADIFGSARTEGKFDSYEIYELAGIKPKYQDDYFRYAPKARPDDAADEVDGDDE